MNKLLTIVVPVYKVEPYINKCLDSCVLDDDKLMNLLEVIIVNDGTPDNSAEMSREYVKRYPKTFLQIDKENGGHGSAWNVGLKEATGKYLRFLDSDDWLTNLDKLMYKLQNTDADIIFSEFVKWYINDNSKELITCPQQTEKAVEIDKTILDECYQHYELINFWQATYKRNILLPLWPLFAEHVMYDDSILFISPFIYGRTYESVNYPVYNYLLGREGQSMLPQIQQKNVISYAHCIDNMENVRKMCDNMALPSDNVNYIDSTICAYVYNFVYLFVNLPYLSSKKVMRHIIHTYTYPHEKKPHWLIRYQKFPFWLFFIMERIRGLKSTKSKKKIQ